MRGVPSLPPQTKNPRYGPELTESLLFNKDLPITICKNTDDSSANDKREVHVYVKKKTKKIVHR